MQPVGRKGGGQDAISRLSLPLWRRTNGGAKFPRNRTTSLQS